MKQDGRFVSSFLQNNNKNINIIQSSLPMNVLWESGERKKGRG
jgi:hypothetical protein